MRRRECGTSGAENDRDKAVQYPKSQDRSSRIWLRRNLTRSSQSSRSRHRRQTSSRRRSKAIN